ncbi:hypothetical protein KXD93_28680 [Mucilaginibacter sp. BJC16-A38]|uniref:hypothetical protein n=1 Tax=Mucilaginibacter phenanthrenivorans TaxID=1234842 RepID=UPI0021573763|nr:hypothetical protein [Mucilaginibacter phenanthrenivorans]MCR8561665.1 hypothetical protein [Mucilaginibacter phenanthrenivorans]
MKRQFITTLLVLITVAAIAQKRSAKKPAPIVSDAKFHVVVDYKGHKEFFSTQYQNHDGMLYPVDNNGKLTIFFAADNDKTDDRLSVSGVITAAEQRSFSFDDNSAHLSIMLSNYPDVPAFELSGGNITITAMPLKGGQVRGTFTGSGFTVDNNGQRVDYSLTGDFSLTRM